MQLINYFRQLKKIIVLPIQFLLKGITNPLYYSYYWKIFFKFLICGLFKDNFQIKFGNNYWKHVPKYIFSLLTYLEDFLDYKLNMFYYNKIKKLNVLFLYPSKPFSPKYLAMHISVEEDILEDVSENMGFKIIDENLTLTSSIYTLTLSSN